MLQERFVSKDQIRLLLQRTETFWSKRVQNKSDAEMFNSSMEHCFYESGQPPSKPAQGG